MWNETNSISQGCPTSNNWPGAAGPLSTCHTDCILHRIHWLLLCCAADVLPSAPWCVAPLASLWATPTALYKCPYAVRGLPSVPLSLGPIGSLQSLEPATWDCYCESYLSGKLEKKLMNEAWLHQMQNKVVHGCQQGEYWQNAFVTLIKTGDCSPMLKLPNRN